MAVDAAAGADERRHVDRAEAEEGQDEQRRVEPVLRAREVEVVAEAGGDAGERRRVDALALLPPVDARLLAHPLEVRLRSARPPPASGCGRRAGRSARRIAQSQSPQPSCWRCGQSLGSRSPSRV